MTREEALKQLRELKFALSGTDEQLLDIVALDMAIEALEQEPCKDADTISRQAAIRWVKTECNPYGKPTLDFESGKKVIEHLKQMSPVTPQPKTGHWIDKEEKSAVCSCCKKKQS